MEPLTIWKLAEEHEYQEAWIIGSILGTKPWRVTYFDALIVVCLDFCFICMFWAITHSFIKD
jgi:hypothetical protein